MNRITKKCVAATFVMALCTLLAWGVGTLGHCSDQKEGVYYTCPMPEHSDVVMDKPGTCPKCGMELVKREAAATKYTCPMKEHADVVMDNPGKCPKCGMELVPKKIGGN